ncbi:RNase adapter RapZ [Marinicella sp. W31]|uniref:RNase adapter RapZ n=1 Tax=Marinicella sp. W31 TaxID=3023713 RepID=UPI0037564699
MQQLVLLTGLSGAGKTVVLRSLEDMEYYCVDNLPVDMLPQFVKHILGEPGFYPKVAVGVDIRSTENSITRLPPLIDSIREEQLNFKVIFLNADQQVLFNRFSETRRRHPLSTHEQKYSLTEAIKLEIQLMQPIKNKSDLLIDTSKLSVHHLRQQVWKLMSQKNDKVSIILRSFAFKRGVPFDSDFVFDARCLPNPYWQKELRHFTGRDSEIEAFFEKESMVAEYYRDLCGFCKTWIPRFEANDRSYITIAIGCTGGQHRSVYLIEQLHMYLSKHGIQSLVAHRELDDS